MGDPVAQLVKARELGIDRMAPSLAGKGAVEAGSPEDPLVAAGRRYRQNPKGSSAITRSPRVRSRSHTSELKSPARDRVRVLSRSGLGGELKLTAMGTFSAHMIT